MRKTNRALNETRETNTEETNKALNETGETNTVLNKVSRNNISITMLT